MRETWLPTTNRSRRIDAAANLYRGTRTGNSGKRAGTSAANAALAILKIIFLPNRRLTHWRQSEPKHWIPELVKDYWGLLESFLMMIPIKMRTPATAPSNSLFVTIHRQIACHIGLVLEVASHAIELAAS
jgi:hypothetical protein